jgi:hypothetical protein
MELPAYETNRFLMFSVLNKITYNWQRANAPYFSAGGTP